MTSRSRPSCMERAKEHRQTLLDTALSVDDAAMEEYFEKGDVAVETLKRCIKAGTISRRVPPRALRHRVQEQGRAAAARRGARLSAVAASTCPASRSRPRKARRRANAAERRRIKADPNAPFAGLAFKIINDKYGTLDLRARLCRHAEIRRHGAEHHEGPSRAHRPHVPDARRQARRDQGSVRRRHRRLRRA